jgi:hypothetical protein
VIDLYSLVIKPPEDGTLVLKHVGVLMNCILVYEVRLILLITQESYGGLDCIQFSQQKVH